MFHFITILSIAAVILTALGSGSTLAYSDEDNYGRPDCYHDGETLTNSIAKYHAQRACQGYDGIKGYFQDKFPTAKKGDYYKTCVDTYGSVGYHMAVRHHNNHNHYKLNGEDCFKGFTRAIDRCPNGGNVDYKHINYWIDPNAGKC